MNVGVTEGQKDSMWTRSNEVGSGSFGRVAWKKKMGGCLKRKKNGGAQQIIRCKKCAYHSPDKEAYLLKGRVCEPFAHAWNCYVRTCCRTQPGHGRPRWRSSIRQPAAGVRVKRDLINTNRQNLHGIAFDHSFELQIVPRPGRLLRLHFYFSALPL